MAGSGIETSLGKVLEEAVESCAEDDDVLRVLDHQRPGRLLTREVGIVQRSFNRERGGCRWRGLVVGLKTYLVDSDTPLGMHTDRFSLDQPHVVVCCVRKVILINCVVLN